MKRSSMPKLIYKFNAIPKKILTGGATGLSLLVGMQNDTIHLEDSIFLEN